MQPMEEEPHEQPVEEEPGEQSMEEDRLIEDEHRPTRGYCLKIYSNLAIKHYNEQHQNDEFMLEVPLCCTGLYTLNPEHPNLHLNFIARSKSSQLKLFFATFKHRSCLTCSIVHPGNPLFQVGCVDACHPAGAMYHPSLEYRRSGLQGGYHHLDLYEESAKKLLREAYAIISTVQELNTEEANKLKNTYDAYVLKAITKYNLENDVAFEYLETVFGVRFRHNLYSFEGVFWVHLIFKAKNCTGDNSPVLFFAQLGLDSDSITCVAIQNTHVDSSFPGDKTSEVCPKHCSMLHPPDVYANCAKGKFADSLWNGRCWSVKSELLGKAGDVTHTARMEHLQHMERRW